MSAISRHLCYILICFALSTVFTALFIRAYGGYVSTEIMVLSGLIAGGKWAIQMVAGWLLLGGRRWQYLRDLGTTCLAGSCVLIPFALFPGPAAFFFGSLLACIIVMTGILIFLQRRAKLPWRWSGLWMILLASAVTLQLTVVFHVFP